MPKPTLRSLLVALARIVAVLYVGAILLMFFVQDRLIFQANKLRPDHHFLFDSNFEEKVLEVDGLKIDSLVFHPKTSHGVILYFHGNAGDLAGWGYVAQELAERTQADVWILDYPGYGKSEGAVSSELQLHRVADAFYAAAKELAGSDDRLVLFGRSVGSGLAARLAAEHEVGALILETPYVSFTRLVREKFRWVPTFLLKYAFPSYLWLPNVRSPILIVHGDRDEVIPFAHGEELAKSLPAATFAVVKDGHHNDLAEFPAYWSAVEEFVQRVLPAKGSTP